MTRLEQDQEDRLGDDERALLLALRDEEAMPTDARARVWSRLEARLDEPRATAGQSPRALVVITALALAAAVSLFVFGPELGVLVNATPRPSQAPHEHEERAETRSLEPSTPTPEDPARAVELPAPTTTDVVEAPEPSPTEVTPAPPVLRPRSAVASSREADAPAQAADASASSIAEETAALRSARRALADGAPERALELLDAHARQFPTGALVEERSALRIIALCTAGKRHQGRGEARQFLRAHPGSALASRVRSACPEG